MKKRLFSCFAIVLALSGCQQPEEKKEEVVGATEETATNPALCDFASVDSVTAQAWLKGEWVLSGIKTTRMGTKPDEFLTGELIEVPKELTFYPNNEFEQTINGKQEGGRQKYVLDGQSLSPLAYQFWFCGINTLVLSNVAADGPVEVYTRK